MNNTSIRVYVAFIDRAKRLVTDEKGEIGSWLILAAGLVVAAGIAATALDGWIQGVVARITAN